MKYRIKFVSKTDPKNKGYYVRKLKVGFKGCSLNYPESAKVVTEKDIDKIMQFLNEQGELDYYNFIIEEIK